MNDKGGIFEIEAPIHVSNVKVIDEKEVKTTKRVEKVEEKAEKKAKTSKKGSK